jgi:hypothetical protein
MQPLIKIGSEFGGGVVVEINRNAVVVQCGHGVKTFTQKEVEEFYAV